MFNLTKEDLMYEKYLRLLEDGEGEGKQPDPIDPETGQPMKPEKVYQMGLEDIKKTISETGRKRYQKYKLDGGQDTFAMFKKNMENQLKQELEDEMREQYGGVPGQETEKELLGQIKNLLADIKQQGENEMSMAQNMAQGQPMEDPNAQPAPEGQPMEDPNAQPAPEGQEVQEQPEEQQEQPMNETYMGYMDRVNYKKAMKEMFNYYFG